MRQLVFTGPGQVAWQDAPDPGPPPADGAVVRPTAVARCDLDAPMAAFGIFPGPYPVGHELVAEVVSVGADVTRVRPGERVCVPFQVSCGSCPECGGGRFAACRTYRAPAGAAWGFGARGGGHPGAVADLMAVPHADHLLMPAPEGLSDAALCLLPDNAVDAYRTVGPQLAGHPAADVLVVGGTAPSIGLYAVALASALGAGSVRYVDDDEQRCAAADALGADVTQHVGAWPRRFDRAPITVDGTGTQEGLACVLRSTAEYGTCTVTAIQFGDGTVPLLEMYSRGVTLHLSRADSRRHLPAVLELAASGRFDPLAVPTTVVDWGDADTAWLSPAIKLVLTRRATGQ